MLHGYFRSRVGVWDNIPTAGPTRDGSGDAAFGHMRLRMEPSIVFGSNRFQPAAALRGTFDMLDNVVFGDNARLNSTPLFANDPSNTSLFSNGTLGGWGGDAPPIYIRRLWLEFMTPIGQIRVGRQGSHGGLGLLFNDGGTGTWAGAPDQSFRNDFGDALGGTTFDRIMFLTRPLSIVNTLARTHIAEYRGPDDQPTTPLVLGVAYDWLVEDVLTAGRPTGTGVSGESSFSQTARETRSRTPYGFLTNGADDVWQTTLILAWADPEFNASVSARDELIAGFVGVHRGQQSTSSSIYIGDLFYRVRYSPMGRRGPTIYSEGELYTIQGTTNGVALPPGGFCNNPSNCPDINEDGPDTPNDDVLFGRTYRTLGANIWGGAARLGLESDMWAATLESGFSSGQRGNIFDPFNPTTGTNGQLSQRPNSGNYQVGLLLYPVTLAIRTSRAYEASPSLWSNGGVWNSAYMLPQIRFRPLGQNGGVEIVGQFILAFADQLNTALNESAANGANGIGCSSMISSTCLLGWESDLALKVSWGPHDEMRWSNEFGIMGIGDALGGVDPARPTWGRLTDSYFWTLQSRIAFVY